VVSERNAASIFSVEECKLANLAPDYIIRPLHMNISSSLEHTA
jgi:hypothetical protein